MYLKTKAIVLREVTYKDSDKILTLLTQEAGTLAASARGCRKKNSPIGASSQLLVWSDLVLFQSRGKWTVQEAAVEQEFRGVRQSIEGFALGCYMAELTELLAVEGIPSPEILSLLLNSLYILDCNRQPVPLVKAVFELKAMCIAGYEPIVDACGVCGTQNPVEPCFYLPEGVLHCQHCRNKLPQGESIPIGEGVLAAIRHIVYGNPKKLFAFQLGEGGCMVLGRLAESYLLHQMERNFRTLDFYKQITAPYTEQPNGGQKHD